MEFVRGYNTWSLGKQMQVLFISSSIIICAVLVIITKVQLDWLRGLIVQGSQNAIENRVFSQMHILAQLESKFISAELLNFVYTTEILHNTDQVLNSLSSVYQENPFVPQTAYLSSDFLNANYSTGAYYSKISLSDQGSALVNNESCMNSFYPLMYSTSVIGFFQGYFIDEILYFYPAQLITSTNYSPLASMWFYTAIGNLNDFMITEPYAGDTSENWVVGISKALIQNNRPYGVVALNASLDSIMYKLSNISIEGSGFALLIGAEGVILNLPESWKLSGSNPYTRIFNQSTTGIDMHQWNNTVKQGDGVQFSFVDVNNKSYTAVLYSVVPKPYFNATDFMMLCVDTGSLQNLAGKTSSGFDLVYQQIFWVILAIGIFVVVLQAALIFFVGGKSTRQLVIIEKIFESLLKTSLYPYMVKTLDCGMLENYADGFEALADACKIKLKSIEKAEESFKEWDWRGTRPDDRFVYNEWTSEMYPYNYYCGKPMLWRSAVVKLKMASFY